MKILACAFALFALSPFALAGGGSVELVLHENLLPIGTTNPLPVTGTFSVGAPTGTSQVNQVGVVITPVADVVVTTASTAVIGADATRGYLLIQNKGPENVYMGFGAPAVIGSGVIIGAGGNYEALKAATNSVFAVAATGSTTLATLRGN